MDLALQLGVCDVGSLQNLTCVKAHVESNKHTKKMATLDQGTEKDGIESLATFKDHIWNLPDYVDHENGILQCTLCPSSKPQHVLDPMLFHLGSDAHAKVCRKRLQAEIILNKEKKRLEYLADGTAVVRTGCVKPNKQRFARSKGSASQKNCQDYQNLALIETTKDQEQL